MDGGGGESLLAQVLRMVTDIQTQQDLAQQDMVARNSKEQAVLHELLVNPWGEGIQHFPPQYGAGGQH